MGEARYSLYIVRCSDDSLYTGIAIDVEKRLRAHESGAGGAKYLRGRGPLELVFVDSAGDRAAAQRAEHRVKRLDRAGKEALVAGRLTLDELLATPAA